MCGAMTSFGHRYLLATAGIREWDLYRLKNPLQIADVLILPMDGFKCVLYILVIVDVFD